MRRSSWIVSKVVSTLVLRASRHWRRFHIVSNVAVWSACIKYTHSKCQATLLLHEDFATITSHMSEKSRQPKSAFYSVSDYRELIIWEIDESMRRIFRAEFAGCRSHLCSESISWFKINYSFIDITLRIKSWVKSVHEWTRLEWNTNDVNISLAFQTHDNNLFLILHQSSACILT